ncbi:hypothetical protein GPDM_05231 [Planococcus donghaensis MPA1U2]|uniref:DNA topology modulation protein FlaR n=1 Tax=Planococcus donghaensis MPA1U2 TaxID=933115 RepID=E7RF04_9BACL|nr:hypothetical protein GPDM_05231 [Planococcus donghaensis MPA1U2]
MKIYILGSVGSGKTTVARRLSVSLCIPHFETDNFVWHRQTEGDIRNPESVRDAQFLAALEQPSWIIEGVHIGWTDTAIHAADTVIFLDIPYHRRTLRFVFRYISSERRQEKSSL